LRIGITLAKTLAFATGAKVVAVPSMRVLVENASSEAQHGIVVLDAKREQVFTARFERVEGKWVEREAAHVEALSSMLERAPRPVELIGEGIAFHKQFIPQDTRIVIAPEERWRARAGVLARLGRELAQEGRFVDPFVLEPIYIRPPEAQEKLEGQMRR
jgi:tRNA threonylcarbamoyladenosine biosynthesis protein TsaB